MIVSEVGQVPTQYGTARFGPLYPEQESGVFGLGVDPKQLIVSTALLVSAGLCVVGGLFYWGVSGESKKKGVRTTGKIIGGAQFAMAGLSVLAALGIIALNPVPGSWVAIPKVD